MSPRSKNKQKKIGQYPPILNNKFITWQKEQTALTENRGYPQTPTTARGRAPEPSQLMMSFDHVVLSIRPVHKSQTSD